MATLKAAMSGLRRGRLAFAAAGVALISASCADDKPLNMFEPRGELATDIDDGMTYIWIIMAIVFVLVIGGAIWLTVQNRVKPEDYDPEDLPAQVHGNTRLELIWTILPGVLLAVISVPMVSGIWRLEEKNDAQNSIDVMVIGQQWWWEYRYDVDGDGFFIDGNEDGVVDALDQELPLELILDPDDVVTANELVIPAGEQVDLILTSRDVIHSYWLPRLNGKRDTVPGRWHTWAVDAAEPGKFTGWCTEYCGLSHARMRMSAMALTRPDFDAWLANQALPAEKPTGEQELAGYELFQNQCMSCHVINEGGGGDLDYPDDFVPPLTAGAAPNLTHFATRTVYAGGIYGQYAGPGTDPADDAFDVADYLKLPALAENPQGPDDYRWNAAELKRWVRDAPSRKAMSPEDERGMLPFTQLTDEQLDQIVAYLATLD